jgi:hypothetical protein
MGIQVNQQEAMAKALDNKNAGKEWIEGSDGNQIEPLPGDQVSPEELEQQFLNDFGDQLDHFEDIDVMADLQASAGLRPISQQLNDLGEQEIVTPTGQVINPQNREIPLVAGQKKRSPTASEQVNARNRQYEPMAEQVDLSNYVPKSEYESLQQKNNELQGQFTELKGKLKNIEGLEGVSKEELTYLRKIKYDYENTPLGIIVSDYYNKKFDPNKFVSAKQSPQDYMSDDEIFDVGESYTVGTPSYDARQQFDDGRVQIGQTYNDIAAYLKEEHSKQTITPEEAEAEWEVKQRELFTEIENKFPNANKNMPVFQTWLSKQGNVYIPLYVAFTQLVKNAAQAKRGGNPPAPTLTAGGVGSQQSYEYSDPEMSDVFGD